MNFQENSFEGLKPSGYYNTAIYDEDGNILELRIMKNTLTKWFAMNIALYLLSRGYKFTYNSVDYYIVTPALMVFSNSSGANSWFFSHAAYVWNNNQAFHQISQNYADLNNPSGGGFGGVIYLSTLDPPSLGPSRNPSYTNYNEYKIQISGGNGLQFHEYGAVDITSGYPYFSQFFTQIDSYTSGTKLILDLTGSNVVASIKGDYTFSSNYTSKCILTLSGGKPAEFQDVSDIPSQIYAAYVANILTFRQFQVNFTQGQTISVEWKVVIQI